jgi:iron complex outermembrane receptor protein
MLALRGDWSSLQDFQLSPKGSIVYTVAPDHSVRFSYSRAFQTPNSLEYFLNAAVAPPADLTAFNGFCTPFGVDCKFGPTPVVAVGNEDLRVETVQAFEVGYRGVLKKAFLTAEFYRTHSSNLVTSLLPQLGTALGRLNPRFGAWNGPAGLPRVIVDQINALVPLLSTDASGANVLAAASYTNFAKVDSQGFDVGLSYAFGGGWRSMASYSWFDFSLPDDDLAAEGLLLPNTPPHTVTAGLGYDHRRIGASIDARWVDHFRWADGFFVGNVESFFTMDATASYPISAKASVGLSATNLLDGHHWQTFGGAVLRRRVLASLRYDW